jgi:hypothetical protein
VLLSQRADEPGELVDFRPPPSRKVRGLQKERRAGKRKSESGGTLRIRL